MTCEYCKEPILEHEVCGQPNFHQECAFRAIAGSVAHIERRCGCYVQGSGETDPPGMTAREAARAALRAWKRQARTALDKTVRSIYN